MSRGDDGFLSRWSRLKREGDGSRAAPEAEADAAPGPEPEEEPFDPESLPDPDTMEAGDDFTVFLKAKVPEELRRRALRRLWRSNPVLACVDGLNDYDDDYTGGGVPVGQLKTAFEVGRGILREAAPRPAQPPAAEVLADETLETDEAETPKPAPEAAPARQAQAEAPDEDAPPMRTRRRMSFDFTGQS